MADFKTEAQGSRVPGISDRGHPLPRRATPEASVTLRHHRMARDASMVPPCSGSDGRSQQHSDSDTHAPNLPQRHSSGDSNDTSRSSDPKKWFDRSNKHPSVPFDQSSMDVDPPFYQKESDSSNEDCPDTCREAGYYNRPGGAFPIHMFKSATTHSSSADDYRSVIDDLTIENKRLKEELKKYKQFGSSVMREEKLFEIKVHGLPRRKKRELEATLRDFAAGLEESTAASTKYKSSEGGNRLQASSNSHSKHGSSSSHSRPIDSGYASMSTGLSSASNGPASLERPSRGRTQSSQQTMEGHILEIPEGLYPRHMTLTEKERKKWVVRRLERLFTGEISGTASTNETNFAMDPPKSNLNVSASVDLVSSEASREAPILAQELAKKTLSRDAVSAFNLNGEAASRESEMGGGMNGSGSGSGGRSGDDNSASTITPLPAEQRPTRPRDLDPDRVQVPSDNMQYIRHLGLAAPDSLADTQFRSQDVSLDADGWIHLNLLCSLAQLHIINVTPDFIRSAVSEQSAKFQLSRDGRRIRWRGGTEGTKFSSDSSGENSQRSPYAEETDRSNETGQNKRRRTVEMGSTVDVGKKRFELEKQQASASSDSFHYKPLFVHRSSSNGSSQDDSGSLASYGGALENSNLGTKSRSTLDSGSGSFPRKKRRIDGPMVYYSGAPFCTDLSGDPGDSSPTAHMTTAGREHGMMEVEEQELQPVQSESGFSLEARPLPDGLSAFADQMDLDLGQESEFISDDTELSDDDHAEFPWCDELDRVEPKRLEAHLEPCGLGGVMPEDHFAMTVVTRHPINVNNRLSSKKRSSTCVNSIFAPIACLSTRAHGQTSKPAHRVQVQQLAQKYKDLPPLPLPPPTMFFPPFSSSSGSSCFDDNLLDSEQDNEDMETESSEANPRMIRNDFSPSSSNDDDEQMDGDDKAVAARKPTTPAAHGTLNHKISAIANSGVRGVSAEVPAGVGSSVATAGGEESGYSSGKED